MGKKQHQKDKLWLTCTEWRTIYGGKKAVDSNRNKFKRLPFYCCSLKFDQTTHPCCTKEGIVFDMQNILEYIKKHKINPVTGAKLSVKQLIKLKFHKNVDGEYHCPITYKQLGDNSHIVAVPHTGNVFSLEGLSVSNLRPDVWVDPLDPDLKEFPRADLVTIQDPDNLDKFNMNTFYHTNGSTSGGTDGTGSNDNEGARSIRVSSSLAAEALKEVRESALTRISTTKQEKEAVFKDKINEANYSTGKVTASLTSTVAPVAYINDTAVLSDDVVRYSRISEKGYASLLTNFGRINLELFCDIVPKTCENFIKHCKSNYYDNTKFHRLIRHFVLQGGDPTGKGNGGQSIWGKPFPDEFVPKLSHNARGVLSMANLGPNSNTSQFFILLRPAKHLDNKHTIFGKVVGGMKVLDEIEKIESDNNDRPIEPVEIICTEVFVDPYEKVDESIRLERERMADEKISKPIDESLKPKNRREEELFNAKRLQGTRQYYQAQSKEVGKYVVGQSSDETLSISSKKSNNFKRPFPVGTEDKKEDLEEISEYDLKQKRRILAAETNAFECFNFNF